MPCALLLVDGYNVIGAWQHLQQLRDRHGLEAARTELVELLSNYSAYQGYLTNVVFDAQYRATPGQQEQVTEQLVVSYTDSEQTADTYIEMTCASHRDALRTARQRVIVATSDRAQQLTVIGFGAEWMSTHRLALDVEASIQKVRQWQAQQRRKHQPKTLGSRLDDRVRRQLEHWRRQS